MAHSAECSAATDVRGRGVQFDVPGENAKFRFNMKAIFTIAPQEAIVLILIREQVAPTLLMLSTAVHFF